MASRRSSASRADPGRGNTRGPLPPIIGSLAADVKCSCWWGSLGWGQGPLAASGCRSRAMSIAAPRSPTIQPGPSVEAGTRPLEPPQLPRLIERPPFGGVLLIPSPVLLEAPSGDAELACRAHVRGRRWRPATAPGPGGPSGPAGRSVGDRAVAAGAVRGGAERLAGDRFDGRDQQLEAGVGVPGPLAVRSCGAKCGRSSSRVRAMTSSKVHVAGS
jgi:hypothetical protein